MSGAMDGTETGKAVRYSKVWNLPNILTYGRIVAVPIVAGLLMGLDAFMWRESVAANRMAVSSVPWFMLVLVCLLRWVYARHQYRYLYWALFLFGLLLFSYLLVRSKLFHKLGRVRWKGREYATGSHASEPRRSTRVKAVS